MWFREYIFNVLIQPFHLVIYTILVGSAITLVTENMIYGIVAIGFLIPAEKLLRKFFGFDNAGTLSAAGSFAGGAVFSAMINKLNRPKSGRGGQGGEESSGGNRGIRKASRDGIKADDILIGGAKPGPGGSGSETGSGSGASIDSSSETGSISGSGSALAPRTAPTPKQTITPAPASEPAFTPSSVKTENDDAWKNINKVTAFNRLGKGSIGAVSALGNRYERKLEKGIEKGLKNVPKSLGRWTRKAAIGGIAGGALGLTGAAIGIASGDAGNALKLAAAGGAAGYYGANYYGDKLAKEAGGAAKDATVGFWGDDYAARQQYLYDKEFKRDPQNMNTFTKYFGPQLAKEHMENDVQAFLNAGVSDPRAIAKALQLMDKGELGAGDEGLKKAVALTQWNRDAGKGIYDKNSRAYQVFRQQTVNEIMNGNSEFSGDREKAENEVDKIIGWLSQIELSKQ